MMTIPPVSLDTTPAGLLLENLRRSLANPNGWYSYVLSFRDAEIVERALAAALATSSPPAPQEQTVERPWDTCRDCRTATHCSHYSRCLAECQPSDLVTPAVPDHAGLIARLEAAGPMIVKRGRASAYIEIDEADYHAILAALRPTGGETHE